MEARGFNQIFFLVAKRWLWRWFSYLAKTSEWHNISAGY